MRYYLRDSAVPLPEGDDRFSHLSVVRVDKDEPSVTAQRLASAGEDVYVQFYYDDPDEVELPTQQDRRDYWLAYTTALAKELVQLGVTKRFLCLEHPSTLGWNQQANRAHRHDPEWYEVYGQVHRVLGAVTGSPVVTQFGYPPSGHVLYQLPVPQYVAGAERGTVTSAWVNLSGQHAFGDHHTTWEEFCFWHAYCAAMGVEHVVLWSNPLRTPSEALWERMVEAMRLTSPVPPRTSGPSVGSVDPELVIRERMRRWWGG